MIYYASVLIGSLIGGILGYKFVRRKIFIDTTFLTSLFWLLSYDYKLYLPIHLG